MNSKCGMHAESYFPLTILNNYTLMIVSFMQLDHRKSVMFSLFLPPSTLFVCQLGLVFMALFSTGLSHDK